MRWSQERGFFVENLFVVDCDSLDDCLAVLEEGLRNRTTGAQASNEHSSRSHSVLTIYAEIKGFKNSEGMGHRYGKISFVDLAGSEKVKESKSTLDTFAEALSINKSLLTLGKCISALSDPKTRKGHIPFRDSKLTKLLSDSLSGRGSALMIACVSPSSTNLNETLKTLRYAMQAKRIQNRPVIQLDPQEEMVMNLKLELQSLRRENAKFKSILEKDEKYHSIVKEIVSESLESSRNHKSRVHSPILGRRKSIKNESRSTHLPEIRNSNDRRAVNSRKDSSQVASLPRFSSTRARKPSMPNRPRNTTKSASKQRVDELKRSYAPAGQEKEKTGRSVSRHDRYITNTKSRSQTPANVKKTTSNPTKLM